MTPNKLIRLCPLFLPLLLSLSGFQSTFAQPQALNLSTRLRVWTDGSVDNVGIAGFIITGTGTNHKAVLIRGIGPSLAIPPPSTPPFPMSEVLTDPMLTLTGPSGFVPVTNCNWRDTQENMIFLTTIPPRENAESAILIDLSSGNYTATITEQNPHSGIALVEIYDLTHPVGKLANISTRAFVGTGDNRVIAGFILGNGSGFNRIVVRGLGPSLTAAGVHDVLANPTLELLDSNANVLMRNNDWQDNPAQAAEITADGLAPTNNVESAIAMTLPPGNYTVLLAELSGGMGNGLVEIYDLGP